MRSTDIKEYIDLKEQEFSDVQALYVRAAVDKTNVVYQKYSFNARALEGKLGRIQNQIQGALNIVDNISSQVWTVEDLAFIENLAKDEFNCHVFVDARYQTIKLEKIIAKVIEEMGVSSNDLNVKRLTGVKDHLAVNVKRYNDYDYRLNWITDRYFEIAAFIKFEGGDASFEYDERNSIYDIVSFGEKTVSELKASGLFFDVLKNRYTIIKEAAEKDIFFERNR